MRDKNKFNLFFVGIPKKIVKAHKKIQFLSLNDKKPGSANFLRR